MSEEFEKWLKEWCARHPNPSTPLQPSVVWDASRKQALADAIKACDTVDVIGADDCIDAIRSIQQK